MMRKTIADMSRHAGASGPVSIPVRLQQETAEQHEALERDLPLTAPELTPALYRETLAGFWGFYATWERLALETTSPALTALVHARLKLHLIEADLLALAHSADILWELRREAMDPSWLPDLRHPAKLLGSMYVIESSTLGGQIISRHLEAALTMSHGWGYSFFLGYGSDTGLRWKAFTAILERAPAEEGDTIVAAARQTFTAFHRWLKHRHLPPPAPVAGNARVARANS